MDGWMDGWMAHGLRHENSSGVLSLNRKTEQSIGSARHKRAALREARKREIDMCPSPLLHPPYLGDRGWLCLLIISLLFLQTVFCESLLPSGSDEPRPVPNRGFAIAGRLVYASAHFFRWTSTSFAVLLGTCFFLSLSRLPTGCSYA
ncbi:hypothetical protein GQ54DRAFT_44670 [Martensiomyces pterosporus]|nr:hypothetical protein GQ54DRAFT_44670 [Martensiomyces pterosporus]